VLRLEPEFHKLASSMRQSMVGLRDWEHSDLVQEAHLKVLMGLDRFGGASSLKTWALSAAKNHLISMARHSRHRPRPIGRAAGNAAVSVGLRRVAHDLVDRMILRTSTKDLLGWLRANPGQVDAGWEVLNLLLWNPGNYSYAALAMTLHTGEPWTAEGIRRVIRKIKLTAKGAALCDALGISTGNSDNKD